MPVPFEALIPFGKLPNTSSFAKADKKGLLTVMFGATGTLFSVVKRAQNDWKVSELALSGLRGSRSCLRFCRN